LKLRAVHIWTAKVSASRLKIEPVSFNWQVFNPWCERTGLMPLRQPEQPSVGQPEQPSVVGSIALTSNGHSKERAA